MLRKAFLATAVATAMLVTLPLASAKRAEAHPATVAWVIAGVIVGAIVLHSIHNAQAAVPVAPVKKVRRPKR